MKKKTISLQFTQKILKLINKLREVMKKTIEFAKTKLENHPFISKIIRLLARAYMIGNFSHGAQIIQAVVFQVILGSDKSIRAILSQQLGVRLDGKVKSTFLALLKAIKLIGKAILMRMATKPFFG